MFIRSFLKWPGGKYRVLSRLLSVFPQGKRFVEPFVGSGTVFLNTQYGEYLLCDVNHDLIDTFTVLTKTPERFITSCQKLFTAKNNTPERYYALRSAFNNAASSLERAVLFLYCNRHCYNGLVRYNSKGAFNVPFGRYVAPYFPEREMRLFHQKYTACAVTFAVQEFAQTFAHARTGDVFYCDPPYVPLTPTSNFTAYAGKAFTMREQHALALCAKQAAHAGIPVILSNHDTQDTQKLYGGAQIHTFPVRRSISCAARGMAGELAAVYTG